MKPDMKIKTIKFFIVCCLAASPLYTQDKYCDNKTDISMFLKKDGVYITEVESKCGDLWNELGHHGPAVENLWAAYRIYFDKKAAIDIYNKPTPRLELKKTKWYTPERLRESGYGSDNYWVGNSIGVGSIRLWESDSVKMLNPVRTRKALIIREGCISQIQFLSEGISYKNSETDILIKLTVFSGYRYAKVEAFVLADEAVELVTGVNINPNLRVYTTSENIITWGKHNTDAEVGAALIYNKINFQKTVTSENEYLLISKSTKYLAVWITTASSLEQNINTYEKFKKYVKKLSGTLRKYNPFEKGGGYMRLAPD